MIRLIACIALIAVLWYLYHQWRNKKQNRTPIPLLKLMLPLIAVILLLLTITGKISWFFGLIGLALPWINRLSTLWNISKTLSRNDKTRKQTQDNPEHQTKRPQPPMAVAEALEILELELPIDETIVKRAYQQKIRQHHPDTGGSHYFSKKINLAKQTLLQSLKQEQDT